MNNKKKKLSYKERNGTTRVGDFLRGIKKNVLPALTKAVGLGNLAEAVGIVESGNSGLATEQVNTFLELMKLDMQDVANAREMQVKIATSQNATRLSKNFVYYLAGAVSLFTFVIIIMLFFVKIPEGNQRIIDMSIGILVGSGFVAILTYFFGSSQGSKDKQNFMNAMKKK
ncbi:MAG: hypothetical protein GKR88_09455 [Flavobacteriaceae bacterium]|nr:MAG: hypothetical protein GKR88_09455 [Flavobacteriaceae bacterium]